MTNIRRSAENWKKLTDNIWYYSEKTYPLLLAIICTGAAYIYRENIFSLNGLPEAFVNNSISVAGTLIGFLLTIFTILHSINSRRMQFVREAGAFKSLIDFLRLAILGNILALIVGLSRSMIEVQLLSCRTKEILDFVNVFLVMWALFLTVRFAIIISQLLKDPDI